MNNDFSNILRTFTSSLVAKQTFGKPDWLGYVEAEYKACVEEVGVADLSWQSKVEISVRIIDDCAKYEG